MTATEYFTETTKAFNQQFINWVDVWLFDNGYRIALVGGIVPERIWRKEGCIDVNVRNREVQFQTRIPQTEEELMKLI